MKNRILSLLVVLIAVMSGCQSPDKLISTEVKNGINSVTLMFAEGEFKEDAVASFSTVVDPQKEEIRIIIPWYYPLNSDKQITAESIKKMRVMANLDDNSSITPKLGVWDMTKEHPISVRLGDGTVKKYRIVAEIQKLNLCSITSFDITAPVEVKGAIDETTKEIALITIDDLSAAKAVVSLAPHATISPNPASALDYNAGVTFTVTAHDGVTKAEYVVSKVIPNKVPVGIRRSSMKMLWEKKMGPDLGITVENMTGGMAVSGKYLVLNTRGENSTLVNRETGEKTGMYELPADKKGGLVNFYNTSDIVGNVLINNLCPNAGAFKIWKVAKGLTSAPVDFITWTTTEEIGRKVSVQGNVDADAIITAPLLKGTDQRFARWVVTGGVVQSQTPTIIKMSGLAKGWSTNADLVSSSATDPNGDYFVSSYSDNTVSWVSGASNAVFKKLDDPSGPNYIFNAIDCVNFNNGRYIAFTVANSFTWGGGSSPADTDCMWMLDASNSGFFTGSPSDKNSPKYVLHTKEYRTREVGSANGNGTADVIFAVSPDGYVLNMYFMFTNGWVVAYQFDCIDK